MRPDQVCVMVAAVCFFMAALFAAGLGLPTKLVVVYAAMFIANWGFSQL